MRDDDRDWQRMVDVCWLIVAVVIIVMCFTKISKAESSSTRKVVIIRTYYKPGYQSLDYEQAKGIARIALRRTEKLLPVRFSHSYREIPMWVAPYELDFKGCYRIPDFENGACCPMEYIQRYWEETDIWSRNKKFGQVSMVITPPVGGNPYHNYHWLSGGIALKTCFGQNPNVSIGIVNATPKNILGEPRIRSMAEVYRHELHHAAFNATHQEFAPNLALINVMGTFSPYYNYAEQYLSTADGLPTTKETIKQAMRCIRQKRGKR